jgi:hypothetical protein
MQLLPKILPRSEEQRRADAYRNVLRYEAKLGGRLFGPVPAGHRREFFCLDKHTWIWHEEWTDSQGKHRAVTTRYDVRPNGILKSQGNQSYQRVAGDELRNLVQAAELYSGRVTAALQELLDAG